jgi:hypothetical protein
MLLFTLFGRRAARTTYRLAKATVRDGILVAWLPAPSPKHSFSTFSQNLRNSAFDYGRGVQALAHVENIPYSPVRWQLRWQSASSPLTVRLGHSQTQNYPFGYLGKIGEAVKMTCGVNEPKYVPWQGLAGQPPCRPIRCPGDIPALGRFF